jgi:hypothetical protein
MIIIRFRRLRATRASERRGFDDPKLRARKSEDFAKQPIRLSTLLITSPGQRTEDLKVGWREILTIEIVIIVLMIAIVIFWMP